MNAHLCVVKEAKVLRAEGERHGQLPFELVHGQVGVGGAVPRATHRVQQWVRTLEALLVVARAAARVEARAGPEQREGRALRLELT